MPQIIFNSRIKSLPFPSFIVDFEEKQQISWSYIFDTIHYRYGINKNIIRLITNKNKKVDYQDIYNIAPLNISDFVMTFPAINKISSDHWITFDIFPRKNEKLK
jgi:hypothetical protein